MTNPDIANFKVLLVGLMNSGKTSLVRQFVDGQFAVESQATAGPEVSSFVYHPDDLVSNQLDSAAADLFARLTVRLHVWDCPGQDTLVNATPQSLRNADAAFVCFDITHKRSFDEVPKWLDLVRAQSPNVMAILVGCKADLENERVVSRPDADVLARHLNLSYFETSAKDDDNVQPTFKFVAVNLRQRWYAARPKNSPRQNAVKIANTNPSPKEDAKPKKTGCCS